MPPRDGFRGGATVFLIPQYYVDELFSALM